MIRTNWILLAGARGLTLSPADLDRIAPVLSALESAFQPLLSRLEHETEPAFVLSESAVTAQRA